MTNFQVSLLCLIATLVIYFANKRLYRRFHTLPLMPQGDQSPVAMQKQVAEFTVRVKDSRGITFGTDENGPLDPIKARQYETWDEATELFTGDIGNVKMPPQWDGRIGVALVQDNPLPMNILGVFADVSVGG